MEKSKRYYTVRQVTIVSLITNAGLGIIKTVFGYLGNSHAVFADGLHSFSDLLSDFLVLFAAKFGGQAADHDHPYGHRRIETAATVAVALLVLATGVGILLDAADELIKGSQHIRPHNYVLWIALLSIVANECLFRYTVHIGNQLNSNLLRANAWHSRSDALSSVVVLLGVIGALVGILWLDNLAAIGVGVLIIKMGWDLGWSSVRELVDTGLDLKTINNIKVVINNVPGVRALHCLRTRSMAGDIYIDVHIQVDSTLSVSEGHYISHQVHHQLSNALDNITDVTVHVDPEDDGIAILCEHLPTRNALIPQLQSCWASLPNASAINHIQLHYLEGYIDVDVFFSDKIINKVPHGNFNLEKRYLDAIVNINVVRHVRLWQRCIDNVEQN